MNTGFGDQAYTIVEVMVVLAVSSLLLVSALLLVGGQQAKTEFNQSIHGIQSQINTVINNVSTGFYNTTTSNFTCVASGGGAPPQFTNTLSARGTNQDCIFVGRAMQFAVSDVPTAFNTYNLVGLQINSALNTPVTSISQSKPVVLSPGTGAYASAPETAEKATLGYSLQAIKMTYTDTLGISHPTSVAAFITDFPSSQTNGNLESSSREVDLYAVNGTAIGSSISETTAVNTIDTGTPGNIIPANSVSICFKGGTDLNGTIVISGSGGNLSTVLTLGTGSC